MTEYGSDFLVDWGPRDTFLDPIFAQEHDAHISFGHSARVQQPAPARGWLREISCRAGCRAGSPRARTHPTKIAARIQPDLRIQIVHALSQLDSCTRGNLLGWPASQNPQSSDRLLGRRSPPILL